MVKDSTRERLEQIIDMSWDILFKRILHNTITINLEASMQLHLASIIKDLGTAFLIKPNERFNVELESAFGKKSIDITCTLGKTKAAIELKCFKKLSNRAKDLDMYDVLKDIERLDNYNGYAVKYFIALADTKYYSDYKHKGKAASVSTRHGNKYLANEKIIPAWQGKWKVNRDKEIVLKKDLTCEWVNDIAWCYMKTKR